jgi:hypothetical protein
MWFNSLLALWNSGQRPTPPARRKPRSTRLALEALEDRAVPSGLVGAGHSSVDDDSPGLFAPLDDNQAQSFQASGTFAGDPTLPGNQGSLAGVASPGGSFTGSFSQKGGGELKGTATFNFSSRASLTMSYDIHLNSTHDGYEGNYQVVSGTGMFAGASGSGILITGRGPTGSFSMSGTLSR